LNRTEWRKFSADVDAAERAADAAEGGFAFAFVEGALVTALREGAWLLLDEINLAPPEVRIFCPCLSGVVACCSKLAPKEGLES
jgi:midasin (ATPase involved in ribosome maturation)